MVVKNFESLGVIPDIIEGLKKDGIIEPTDIQEKAIPFALKNKDIIGQSQTGSGKTLAYLLPIFHKIDTSKREMQAIILAPTHELAMQIQSQIKLLSSNSGAQVTSTAIIGQANLTRQVEKLKEKPHIIVGSTGRILEIIRMKKISAHTIKTIVIDEGDKLLDENNIMGVKDLIKTTMKDRQILVFSATLNEKILKTARELMKEPEVIRIGSKKPVSDNITHIYLAAEQRDKIEVLRKLVSALKPEKAIVFVNKREVIRTTTAKLQFHQISAYGIYGTASKEERKSALEGFRNGKIQLLIASDLAARGLHIDDVTHIFNLDLPEDPKEYLHRVGRTGRVGKTGAAISIATKKEEALLRMYEKQLNIKIEEKDIFKGAIIDIFRRKPVVKKEFHQVR